MHMGRNIRLNYSAFTLIELIIVVLIVGILSTLAITHYSVAIEKNKAEEAKNSLRLIRAAERIYYSENGVYYTLQDDFGHSGNAANDNLRLDLNDDTGTNWDYGLTATAGPGFDATASRSSTSGSFSGCVYLITHSSDAITVLAGTCAE